MKVIYGLFLVVGEGHGMSLICVYYACIASNVGIDCGYKKGIKLSNTQQEGIMLYERLIPAVLVTIAGVLVGTWLAYWIIVHMFL